MRHRVTVPRESQGWWRVMCWLGDTLVAWSDVQTSRPQEALSALQSMAREYDAEFDITETDEEFVDMFAAECWALSPDGQLECAA